MNTRKKDTENVALMSGNEAFARGAIEAGIAFCTSYPGTPSTEIAETLAASSKNTGMYVEWSTNEKVALESAAGASWMGIPALCTMKSLGMNVASDFLLNLNLSGSGPGGLVIIVCDDPKGHSSSNEQDSRFYAAAAKIPLLEPATIQQAKDIVIYALKLSQQEEIPIFIRSTTRLSHSQSLVKLGEVKKREWTVDQRIPSRLYNVPAPHLRHKDLQEKIEGIASKFDSSPFNTFTGEAKDSDSQLLIVSTGITGLYVDEAIKLHPYKDFGHLSLVTSYPLPRNLLETILSSAEKVLFIEEVDPFVEDGIRILTSIWRKTGNLFGKRTGNIPSWGEMNTDVVLQALNTITGLESAMETNEHQTAIVELKNLMIPRPLTFCPGCTHRNVFWALQRIRKRLAENVIVTGDIGCYSLGVFYDQAMDTMHAMGSGIGTANGIGQLSRFGLKTRVVTLAGDSTFYHACLPGLINARYHNADILFLILDNATTAMTGFQPHPGTTDTPHKSTVSIEQIVKSIGPDYFEIVDGVDNKNLLSAMHDAVVRDGLRVIIVKSVCRLFERKKGIARSRKPRILVDAERCKGGACRICVSQYGCTALSWDTQNDAATVLDNICIGCTSCITVCPYEAIVRE